MRYFLDTEFLEGPTPDAVNRVRLISLGLVAEDGRELYLENALFDWSQPMPDTWLNDNVRPYLLGPGHPAHQTPTQMAASVTGFVADDPDPVFYAYVAGYDWVALMSIFGRLVDRPAGWPTFCRDIKQTMLEAGQVREDLPPLVGDAHNPLHDARWARDAYNHLRQLSVGSA